MKNLFPIIFVCSLLIAACSKQINPECGEMICTMEFRTVQVKFTDVTGNAVIVKDYSAINQRTKKSTVQNNEPATLNNQWSYIVASDADRRELSEGGDIIVVSATHPQNNKIIKKEFVVNGGLCACHINKISGPTEIVFD